MKTGTKIALFALLCVAMIVAGVLLGRAIQDNDQEQEVSFAILIAAPGSFTLDMSPKNLAGEPEVAVTRGTPAVFTISSTALEGYDAGIAYAVDGLPEGTTYTFSQNPAPAGTAVTLTIQTTGLQSNHGYVCTLTGSPS